MKKIVSVWLFVGAAISAADVQKVHDHIIAAFRNGLHDVARRYCDQLKKVSPDSTIPVQLYNTVKDKQHNKDLIDFYRQESFKMVKQPQGFL